MPEGKSARREVNCTQLLNSTSGVEYLRHTFVMTVSSKHRVLQVYHVLSNLAVVKQQRKAMPSPRVHLPVGLTLQQGPLVEYARQTNSDDCGVFVLDAILRLCRTIVQTGGLLGMDPDLVARMVHGAGLQDPVASDVRRDQWVDNLLQNKVHLF